MIGVLRAFCTNNELVILLIVGAEFQKVTVETAECLTWPLVLALRAYL